MEAQSVFRQSGVNEHLQAEPKGNGINVLWLIRQALCRGLLEIPSLSGIIVTCLERVITLQK